MPTGSAAPLGVVFTPDSNYLISANGFSADVAVFSIVNQTISGATSFATGLQPNFAQPQCLTISPDGQLLAVGRGGSLVQYVFFTVNDGNLSNPLTNSIGGLTTSAIQYIDNFNLVALNSITEIGQVVLVSDRILNTQFLPGNDVTPNGVAVGPDGSFLQ